MFNRRRLSNRPLRMMLRRDAQAPGRGVEAAARGQRPDDERALHFCYGGGQRLVAEGRNVDPDDVETIEQISTGIPLGAARVANFSTCCMACDAKTPHGGRVSGWLPGSAERPAILARSALGGRLPDGRSVGSDMCKGAFVARFGTRAT